MEKPKRLLSLDVFRGITIMMMIIVNNPGNWGFVFSPLKHSKLNGCTPTDLVFPFFMFIMGSAMYYSFKKFDFSLNRDSVFKVLKRSMLIFLIGFLLNALAYTSLNISHIRIMGVLQRIAIAYGLASFIILGFRLQYVKIATVVILLGYWILLLVFGGNDPYSLNDNFVRSFDVFVLGVNHLPLHSVIAFDGTGLLSTLPSIATVLLGFFVGRIIDNLGSNRRVVARIIIYGCILILASLAWSLVFPINKQLWTSSFVLYTSGWAMVVLGILLWIIDVKGYTKWTPPMLAFGKNPLFIYVLSYAWADILNIVQIRTQIGNMVSLKEWMFLHLFSPDAGNMIGSLLFAIHLGIFFWLIDWWLERKRIFIKI